MKPQEEKLIDSLYDEQYYRLLSYARAVLCDAALAEEAVQETFRIACNRAEVVAASPNPQGWLVLTLKNTIRNMQRSRTRLARLVVYAATDEWLENYPAEPLGEDPDILYGDLVGREEYEMLKKFAVEGCSMAELADEYGISLSACKQRVYRARQKLRKILEKQQ